MFNAMRRIWGVRMRAVIAAAAILALLVSAFAVPPEIDHEAMQSRAAAVSVANVGSDDGGRIQLASSVECHAGLSCIPAIMPSDGQGLAHADTAPHPSHNIEYHTLGVLYRPFQPPRILSQV
ncbi:MAG: hypothetical protein CL812_04040 [Confluentimicrobium sp.]|nr:hypothetical protein [Actibacterium sp.]